MPLINNKETQWNGYLVDNLSGATEQFLKNLEESVKNRNLPSVDMNRVTVNMWWRAKSPCLDITSNLDGNVTCTVHAMDYGISLFVGIAFSASFLTDNYYKRMATISFLESIDRCIHEAIEATAVELNKDASKMTLIGKVGKFGG